MITFECAECDQTLEVSDDLAGRKIKCRKCDTRQIVPKPKAANKERGKQRKSALPYILIAVLLLPFIMCAGCLTLVSIRSAISQQSQIHRSIHQGLNAKQWINRLRVALVGKNGLITKWPNPALDEATDAIRFHLDASETVPLLVNMLQEQDEPVRCAALLGIHCATALERNRSYLTQAILPLTRMLCLSKDDDNRLTAAELLARTAAYISENRVSTRIEDQRLVKEALQIGTGDSDELVREQCAKALSKIRW